MAPLQIREGLRKELEQTPGEFRPGVGITKYVSSSRDAVEAARKWWDPGVEQAIRVAGFASLRLPEGILEEMDALADWLVESDQEGRGGNARRNSALQRRMRRLLSKLRTLARWYQRMDEPFRLAYETAEENFARSGQSLGEVAEQVGVYRRLLGSVEEKIDGLAGFDLATLAECDEVVKEARAATRARRVRVLRNRLMEMLEVRYALLREGARIIFAELPHLLEPLRYRGKRRAPGLRSEVADGFDETVDLEAVE